MFGPHERLVSDLWRSTFIDLDAFFTQVREWVPKPDRILEIGCGEGAGTEQLAALYPQAEILAVDIGGHLGRLYRGRAERVSFRRVTVQELAPEQSGRFDLIVMCDVLHHIPVELRAEIIASARLLLAPGGSFVFKDWERTATPIHWICHASDRWLTGDRVRYPVRAEAETMLGEAFGPSALRERATVRPWRNNFALLVQPSP
jgi:2-polyprenyl-6-hydroxyphenyl methylase/3-demethylubiquinone-9 3-methyltransferase